MIEVQEPIESRESAANILDMTPLTQIKIARGLFKAPSTLTEVDRTALAVIESLGGEVSDAAKLGTLVAARSGDVRNQRLLGGRLIKRLEGMGLIERSPHAVQDALFTLTETGAAELRSSAVKGSTTV